MSRILRYLACLFMLIFAGNALAGAYYCPSMKKYTRCEQGYYLSRSSSSTAYYATPVVGNLCRPCSDYSTGNYVCPGGTSRPVRPVTVTYNLNGGTGTPPASFQAIPGTSSGTTGAITMYPLDKGTSTDYYRAGYYLVGWSEDPDATTGSFASRSFSKNTTLYAVWKECTGATYKEAGIPAATTCTACPTATEYGEYARSYSYDTDKTVHDSIDGCQVGFTLYGYTPPENTHIYYFGAPRVICNVCDGDYGVSDSCGEVCKAANTLVIACDASYYNTFISDPDDPYYYMTDIINGYENVCASVGDGYWSSDGDRERTQCPAGYRDGPAATSEQGCIMNVDGGYHVGTAGASTAAQCSADTYMGAHDVNYGSTSTCDTCPSGYPNSVAGSDAITDCYSDTKQRPWTGSQVDGSVPSGCYRVTAWDSCSNGTCSYTAYSNEDGTADGAHKSGCTSNDDNCTKTPSQVTARAGHYVSGATCPACKAGQFQNIDDNSVNGCYLCTGNTYAEGTGNTDCTMCDDGYAITAGSASVYHDERSDCRITCEPGTGVFTPYEQCTTQSGTWYIDKTHTVNAGDTSDDYMNYCIAGYSTPRTTSPSDHDAVGDCTISCNAGTQIAKVNATSCTTPSGNWYIGAHSVSQGDISPVNNCLTNYTITGTSPSNHDNFNDCKISCDGGEYLATKNATSCSDVTPGYWAAPSTVSQGSAGVRNACASGLTTIGFGAGADEAGDCGRVLHIGDDTLYLRSDKKTTHALHVGINGTTFYGNMGTDLSRGSLRIKLGSTTYSVYDDSME